MLKLFDYVETKWSNFHNYSWFNPGNWDNVAGFQPVLHVEMVPGPYDVVVLERTNTYRISLEASTTVYRLEINGQVRKNFFKFWEI